MPKPLRNLAAVLIMVLTIPACSILSPPASDLESRQVSASPTVPATLTRTPTHTPPPTRTPTPTTTPTATPRPFMVELQDNGTTRISDPEYGFRFVLPTGWQVISSRRYTDAELRISASNEQSTTASTNLEVEIDTDVRNLLYYQRHVSMYEFGFGFTIQRQGQTTNSRGTTLAYVEYSGMFGTAHIHNIEIYVLSAAGLVKFDFSDSLDASRYAINMIQDSIQLLEP